MRFGIYTLSKKNLGSFGDKLPEYVFDNSEKRGFFTIGAVDSENNLIGVTQFYIGLLKDDEFISDIIYVYVKEEFRGEGAAGRMLWKSHNIIRKSGVKKSLVFLDDSREGQELFERNGYLFMDLEEDTMSELYDIHERLTSRRAKQGVCWVEL